MSDGWGDASGIEGNYDDEENEAKEDSQTEETNRTSRTNETNKSKPNIKEEWNGRTIYVPDGVLDDMEQAYLESQLKLRNAGRDEFKKNRHFYPLLVQFGVEALSDADAAEIQRRLADIRDG